MDRAVMYVAISLIARTRADWFAGAVPGYDPIAPNIKEFRARKAALLRGFLWLQGAIAAACVAFALDIFVGVVAFSWAPGAAPSLFMAAFLAGVVGVGIQAIVLELGTDGEMILSAPAAELIPDVAQKEPDGALWFLLAIATIIIGGLAGLALAIPGGLVRLHFGPATTPYGPSPAVLMNAVAWCATGALASVLIALGLRGVVKPYVPGDSKRRWSLFLLLVAAASATSIVLTFYGIYALGGSNPAGLGGGLSIASMAVLWGLVADAKASLGGRPEPPPLWPAAPVMVPPPLPPMLAPGATQPGQAATAQGPLFPVHFCPRCGSPDITLAPPPARVILCARCGRAAPY